MYEKPFPWEVIPNTAEYYIAHTTVKSQLIFISVAFAVVLALISLPFVYVDVYVRSAGTLEAVIGRQPVIAPATGKIVMCKIRENQYVRAGDTLLEINADAVIAQLKSNTSRINELTSRINDLHRLLSTDTSVGLQSSYFTAAYARYRERLKDAGNELKKSKRDYLRNKHLYKQKIIAPVQFENFKLHYHQSVSKYQLVKKEQHAQWESLASQYEAELKELLGRRAAILQDKQNCIVKATLNGTLQQTAGLRKGNFVQAGQQLAQISPDTSMEAVLLVDPSDIGFIEKGQKVRFCLDAFDDNQWGPATGEVRDISRDVYRVAERSRPFFRVTCTLDQRYLTLKNGYRGYLRKGMTLQGRFFVARRSLYQLLYDKVDDWFDPAPDPSIAVR